MTNDEAKQDGKKKKLFKILAAATSSLITIYVAYYYFIGSRHVATSNAYVGAEIAQVTAATGGVIKKINVNDTQMVEQGDVLVVIDDADSKLALQLAKANLAKAEAEVSQAKSNYKRRKALKKIDSVSEEEFTNAKNDLISAEASYQAAEAAVNQSKLDLERTIISAPIAGVVARRQVQLGQRVQIGTVLMSITPKDQMHVDANFKEVQLKKVKVGQPVKIRSDLYGSDIVYHGKVAGFSGGTGSAFAVIPAQNATGNWIKVVQRVPVRIELSAEELKQHPLQVGLSMHVDIDVSN
ncbi:MAG: efflux RND transporter periplasmic adaptor subunit [Proteobacteria bacterium]|nr:efflux RND transporter periplasmic adaptor subunit [Pseudomonadota bacterium]